MSTGGKSFIRAVLQALIERFHGPRRLIQVLQGPRQTGKTTLAGQLVERLDVPSVYATADSAGPEDLVWIGQRWEEGRVKARQGGESGGLLVLDEIHKVEQWSSAVKRYWDEDTRTGLPLKVLLLGSSPLLVQRGLTESLAGRFEVIRAMHWSWPEMEAAFGWDLERFLYFGGYPGVAPMIGDPERVMRHILDSIVETTVSRDVLLLHRVDKPALLRRLLLLACEYSGQILSYNKMLGQLQESGSTLTLAHYLDLLAGAGMVAGLQKFAAERVRQRGSSPKLVVMNTALMTAALGRTPEEFGRDADLRGRVVESAVGAHLLNASAGSRIEVLYWREGNDEVDYVLRRGGRVTAIEVKSGRRRGTFPGLSSFRKAFPGARLHVVGTGGIDLAEFLRSPLDRWVED